MHTYIPSRGLARGPSPLSRRQRRRRRATAAPPRASWTVPWTRTRARAARMRTQSPAGAPAGRQAVREHTRAGERGSRGKQGHRQAKHSAHARASVCGARGEEGGRRGRACRGGPRGWDCRGRANEDKGARSAAASPHALPARDPARVRGSAQLTIQPWPSEVTMSLQRSRSLPSSPAPPNWNAPPLPSGQCAAPQRAQGHAPLAWAASHGITSGGHARGVRRGGAAPRRRKQVGR